MSEKDNCKSSHKSRFMATFVLEKVGHLKNGQVGIYENAGRGQ